MTNEPVGLLKHCRRDKALQDRRVTRTSDMDKSLFLALLISGTFGICSSDLQQYYYVDVTKSWLEAQSYCRATYIDLATVGSMEDMNSLNAAVDPAYTGAVWIGLKKHWVLSTGENISAYNNWVPGQPNEENMEAACGVHTQQGWHDWYCSSVFYSVCFDGN
ncbi:hypothetical protein AOLI_G00213740 [Acnodon oligacanthus]